MDQLLPAVLVLLRFTAYEHTTLEKEKPKMKMRILFSTKPDMPLTFYPRDLSFQHLYQITLNLERNYATFNYSWTFESP